MSNRQTQIQFSVFTNSYIERLMISLYQLTKPLECRFYTQGLNDIYIIKTPKENYYLRLSNYGWRSLEDVKAEIELLNYLSNVKLSIAKPVADNKGEFIQTITAPEGTRYAVLFTEARGVYQQNYTLEQNFILGKVIAQLHLNTDESNLTTNRFAINEKHLLTDPLKVIKPYMIHRAKDYDYLYKLSHQLMELVQKMLPKTKPCYGICHGDLHNGNIRVDKNNITLFDFDCFGYGWRAYDLAVYLWNQHLNSRWNKNTDLKEQWNSLISGYSSLRKLSSNELQAINMFVIIREIWFLGLQLGSLDMNRGCDWLSDGYFDYHINFIGKWVEDKLGHIEIL